MCGYPLLRSTPTPIVLAAVQPSPTRYGHEAVYWTDLVVRADSALFTVADALGSRLAYTIEDSQSGYQAPRRFFATFAGAAKGPLFTSLVGPLVTPGNVVQAVLDGTADVGPLDSYAHDLMRRHRPELTVPLRTIATTMRTPIPPMVAAAGTPPGTVARLRESLAAVAGATELADVREALLIERFVTVEAMDYRVLQDAAREADRLGYPRLA
jgi:ABC-type phosphate/phosphonate transport system substrate-binding protein